MTIGEVSRTIKDRVEIRGSFLTVTANKFSGTIYHGSSIYKIVGIIVGMWITRGGRGRAGAGTHP